jgi:hypothetical protein
MTGFCHHFVVKNIFYPIFYNNTNPKGLKNLNLYVTITKRYRTN